MTLHCHITVIMSRADMRARSQGRTFCGAGQTCSDLRPPSQCHPEQLGSPTLPWGTRTSPCGSSVGCDRLPFCSQDAELSTRPARQSPRADQDRHRTWGELWLRAKCSVQACPGPCGEGAAPCEGLPPGDCVKGGRGVRPAGSTVPERGADNC